MLLKKGFNPRFGARPIRRTLETSIEDPLSEALLRGEFQRGSIIEVSAEDGQIIFNKSEAAPEPVEDTNEDLSEDNVADSSATE